MCRLHAEIHSTTLIVYILLYLLWIYLCTFLNLAFHSRLQSLVQLWTKELQMRDSLLRPAVLKRRKSFQTRTMNSYAWCQGSFRCPFNQIFLAPFSLGCFDSAISVRSRRRRSARCKELWQTSERTWTQRLSSPNIFSFFLHLCLKLNFKCRFWLNGFDTADNSHRRRLAEPPSWGDLPGGKQKAQGYSDGLKQRWTVPFFRAPGRDSKKCWGLKMGWSGLKLWPFQICFASKPTIANRNSILRFYWFGRFDS